MLFVSFAGFAQSLKYSRVKVYCNESQLAGLAAAGVAIDHGEYKRGYWFIAELSSDELSIVNSKDLHYDVLVDDVQQLYAGQNDPSKNHSNPVEEQSIGCTTAPVYPTPVNFSLGTMGGYFKYQEILNQLDNMANLYPNLIKAKTAIGTNSIQGRPIYWLRISNNPNVNQAKPQILYTAIHHAREPASVSQLIMYMWYLLENYNSNLEVKYLVDNSEMYFVPLLNPDGYYYNETTNPNGGGMWRKNRKDNGDGTYGVDLNRNYGYNWGLDNIGSSPNTNSDTYRGTGPFSEPETQASRDFCNLHQFKLCVNYHTYGNLLIYPWGYAASTYTPDSAQFTEYGNHLTTFNKYSYGTADQTVLYIVNGSSDDWMYGEQSTKPKIMGMTPEAGRSDEGFWPPQNRIVAICKENIWQNLHACHLILKYAQAKDNGPNYLTSFTGYLPYKFKRLGMDQPATYTVSMIPIGSQFASVGAPKSYSNMTLLQEISDSISYTLNPANCGQVVQYILQVDNGLYQWRDTITKRYGTPVVAFSSNCNTMTGWTSSTGWGTSTQYFVSSPASITDSPGGNYQSNANTNIRTSSQVNLTGALSAQLSFKARWELETNFDYAQVQVSTDNGNTWNALCGKYTKNGNSYQDNNKPVYDAFVFNWVNEQMPLDNYVGQNILIRFRLVSDNGGDYDGFYFDDVKVEKIMPCFVGVGEVNESGISVSQNMPNPAADYTYINYSLPKNSASAKIVVYNAVGQVVIDKELDLNAANVQLNTSTLPQGVYSYRITAGSLTSSGTRMVVVR